MRRSWARPARRWPRCAATPRAASRSVVSALHGRCACRRWLTHKAAEPLSAAATCNQRRDPLAEWPGTARAAGFGAARPQGAAGAARARKALPRCFELLRGLGGRRAWARRTAERPSSGGGSATSGARKKYIHRVVKGGGAGEVVGLRSGGVSASRGFLRVLPSDGPWNCVREVLGSGRNGAWRF